MPWKDLDDEFDIIDDPDPAIYGADGNLRRGDLGPAIVEGINEFAEHMAQYALEQALMALLGPVFGKLAGVAVRFAAKWIKQGWKLIKKDGRYVLRNPRTGACKEIGCFAAGTPVRTPDGEKPIEEQAIQQAETRQPAGRR